MYDARHARAAKGTYSYVQLSNWQMALARVIFQIPRVSGIGEAMRENRLDIGLANEKAKPAVRERLRQLDIPEDAVVFEGARYGRPSRTPN